MDAHCAKSLPRIGRRRAEQRRGRAPESDDSAIDAHNQAIKINPHVADFHTDLGIALFDDGKVPDAGPVRIAGLLLRFERLHRNNGVQRARFALLQPGNQQ